MIEFFSKLISHSPAEDVFVGLEEIISDQIDNLIGHISNQSSAQKVLQFYIKRLIVHLDVDVLDDELHVLPSLVLLEDQEGLPGQDQLVDGDVEVPAA